MTAVLAPTDRELQGPVASFTENGFVHFRQVLTPHQVEIFRNLRDDAVADWQYTHGNPDVPDAVGSLLERYPCATLPVIADSLLLGFAEAVMGPFVQLDSAVLAGDPPVERIRHLEPVMWHRDRFGFVPPHFYLRPTSIVFLAYLQNMSDDVGPLRVLPGSHRSPVTVPEAELHHAATDEKLIGATPGDVVAIHHNLLHSGTRNTGNSERQFLGFIYNLSVFRQEDTFTGPNCQALIATARRSHDRRMLRLLGEDPLIFPRQNSGYTGPHEPEWQRWTSEDDTFAAERSPELRGIDELRGHLVHGQLR